MKLGGAVPQLQDPALVVERIAGVTDRRYHKAGVTESKSRIVMTVVPTAAAMGHHNKRQATANKGPSSATVWVTSPNECGIAGALVGYQIPAVSGGSLPFASFTSWKPTSAARAGEASSANSAHR